MSRRRCRATVVALALAAIGASAIPGIAEAAPRVGRWTGTSAHGVNVSFTIHSVGERRYIANEVSMCVRGGAAGPLMDAPGLRSYAWPVDRRGRIRDLPGRSEEKRSPLKGRLGRTRGVVHGSFGIQSGAHCAGALDPPEQSVRVRWVAAQVVESGRWEFSARSGPFDRASAGFWVIGGAATMGLTGTFFAPAPGTFVGFCGAGPWGYDDAWIQPDGSFAAEESGGGRLTGRFDGTEASGTYSLNLPNHPVCDPDRSPSPFTARLVEPQPPPRAGRLELPSTPVGPPPPDPEPPPDSPYPELPPPDAQAGCSAKVTAGPLEGVASCWRRRGDVYETTGRARINGIDLTPARPGIAIRLDTRSQWITSTGPVEVRLGFLHLYRGPLSWRGRTQVFSIQGRSGSRDPGSPFDVKDVQVFGLPVEGSAELRFDGGKTQLKASIKIPNDPSLAALRGLAGWSGDLTAAATNDAGLVLDGASVTLPGLRVGFVEISDARLAITRTGAGHHHFDGGASVYPFRFARVGFTGELGFGVGDGYFKIGAGVENLNRPLVYGFFLQRIAFSAQINPFGLTGAAGVTFGPQLRLNGSLVSTARLDGSLSYLAGEGGNPAALELAGALELAEAQVADGKVRLSGGVIDVSGNARFTLAGFGIIGGLNGWVDGLRAFNAEGAVTVVIPGPDQSGEAVLSTRGLGACRRGLGPDVGFGYTWGRGLDGVVLFANSCNLGAWRELRPGAAAAARGQQVSRGFRVKRGTRTVALSAVGDGGPPSVAFVAPDGQRFQPSSEPEGVVSTDRVLLVQDAATQTTAFAMDAPPAGRWRIETLPGSAPVRRFRGTTSVAPVRIRARVTGRGARRTLRYRVARLRDARVTFVAHGGGTRQTIGSTRRARGRLRFRPAPGRAGRRRVIALVERGGRPTGRSRAVASFRVGSGRPARPRGIRIRRSARSGRRITWRGPRSLTYSVIVRTPDGRRLLYVREGRRRRVTVPHVPRGQRIRVAIQGRSASGRLSATTRARSRR